MPFDFRISHKPGIQLWQIPNSSKGLETKQLITSRRTERQIIE
ncbi:MAG: hypothetical protein ACFE89_02245 [Candidatus Hodarchaeota archaeon]